MSIYYDERDWDREGLPGEYVYGDYVYIDDYYMDERWRPVRGVPGYWVSNKGRVWSNYSDSFIEGTPLKRSGHVDMALRLNGERIHRYLHRIVAEAFIPNPNNYPIVRHLRDNPADNEVWELEWGDQQDNMQDCINNGNFYYLTRADIEKANAKRRTPIVATCLATGEKRRFRGQQDAARELGIDQSSINMVLHNQRRHTRGWTFEFIDMGGNYNE